MSPRTAAAPRNAILSLTFAAGLLLPAVAAAQTPDTQVAIDSGSIIGKFALNTAVRAFLGVPFAAPPVGELRWKPPQPVAAWSGVRSATSYGAQCMQPGRTKTSVYYEYAGDQVSSEDCLFLNVWAPSGSTGKKLPVMVWIYGGGFQQGSAANPVFDGARLAAHGVVVVSLNYRVGLFGFLAHPELTAESPQHASGNYGLLDQVAGLQWVKRNIAAFGGDADNVTLFGQSAGAASVDFLYGSPLARGLFARGIAESFGYQKPMLTLAEAEKSGAALGDKVSAHSLAELRKVPAQTLLDTKAAANPIVDGVFLTDSIFNIFAGNREAPVPLLTGWNGNEGATFPHSVTLAAYKDWLNAKYKADAERILAKYPAATDEDAKAASKNVVREGLFAWGVWSSARAHAKNGHATYLYHFEHPQPLIAGQHFDEIDSAAGLGTFHSSEYPYIFGTLDGLSRAWTDTDRKLSDQLQATWTAFAYAGSPNTPGLPRWPQFSEATDSTMYLGDRTGPGAVPQLEQLKLFDSLQSPFNGF